MTTPAKDNRALTASGKIYGWLLRLYPKRHRSEYGALMAQLFRDQARDAWNKAGGWGLAFHWYRVLPDLVKTSFGEHLTNWKGRKSMADKIAALVHSRVTASKVFIRVGAVVFTLTFLVAAVLTFILPKPLASKARLKVESERTTPLALELEVIQSELILNKVIESLGLCDEWDRRFANGTKLKTREAIALLRGRVDMRLVRNLPIIEIQAYSENPTEAANIANAIAETYRNYRLERFRENVNGMKEVCAAVQTKIHGAQAKVDTLRRELNISDQDAMAAGVPPTMNREQAERSLPYYKAKGQLEDERRFQSMVGLKYGAELKVQEERLAALEIIDRAQPTARPARPNRQLNLFLGAGGGMILALIIGGVAACWVSWARKKLPGPAAAA